MTPNDPDLLLRKERVGWIAVLSWALVIVLSNTGLEDVKGIAVFAGWMFTVYWIVIDARYRGMSAWGWGTLAFCLQPFAVVLFLVIRPRMPERCHQCGGALSSQAQVCPACGYQSFWGRALSLWKTASFGVSESLSDSAVDRAREMTKSIAIACAALGAFGLVFSRTAPTFISNLAIAGYWALLAWWVYLDAIWRKMNPVPWAVLTLVTNVFGLVAYLIVRYPDPKTCSRCGAVLAVNVKCCPYCGSGLDLLCPVCQSQIKPGWIFCPECATRLPVSGDGASGDGDVTQAQTLSIRGTVVDVKTARPISGASVKIDSKSVSATATTDALGHFVLSGLEVRSYVLVASADGYISKAEPFTPAPRVSKPISFGLHPTGCE
jgi:RNA polymerase subunit RPABC4/transcription elongation factor Spt4